MTRQQAISTTAVLSIGLLLWFLPPPTGIPLQGWHLVSIFFSTILGVILKPFPMGTLSIFALAVAAFTHTLSLTEILTAFQSEVSWLVLLAFFISRGFIQTGLGRRIAYYFVSLLGKRTLGLSYGLLLSDFLLSPAIPSVTARSGGVVFPIAKGIAESFGSDPAKGTSRLIGSFLMKSAYQGSVITSSMFLTAMAANPLVAALTAEAGYTLSWGRWALAACVPGLLSLITIPFVLYKIYPPDIHVIPHAAQEAKQKLKAMGPLCQKEWLMLGIFILLVSLWVLGQWIGMKATTAALGGLALILFFQVLSWDDVLSEKSAWDTFIWFSTLIMLACSLSTYGFTPWVSEQVVKAVGELSWPYAFSVLLAIYFFSHYLFASNTAHVGAMFPAFLMVALAVGTPAELAILAFAFASSLFGGLTHYGSGPAPLYFGAGYVDIKDWWKYGFIISLINIVIWFGLGTVWWKTLGLW